ncbi:MAG: hypothetical protein OJF51_003805 [Nitrospira sp.]|jgi:hypothetical protein|nr:MAG: hypothetical protein OJF51_003805 [Nitrospira sp.]
MIIATPSKPVCMTYPSSEARVPATHPLRLIRQAVDTALIALSLELTTRYANAELPQLPRRSSCGLCCCRLSTVLGEADC